MARTLVDLQSLDVTVVAFDRIFIRIAAIAMQQYCLRCRLHGCLCSKEFSDRCCPGGRSTLIFHPGGAIDEQACCLYICGHVCQRRLNHLEISDTLAKLAALLCKSYTGIQARLGYADSSGSNAQAAAVQGRHGDFEALPRGAEQRTFWHAAFLQDDMDMLCCAVAQFLAGHWLALEAGSAGFNEEGADAFLPGRAVAVCKDNGDMGAGAVGDQDFLV